MCGGGHATEQQLTGGLAGFQFSGRGALEALPGNEKKIPVLLEIHPKPRRVLQNLVLRGDVVGIDLFLQDDGIRWLCSGGVWAITVGL